MRNPSRYVAAFLAVFIAGCDLTDSRPEREEGRFVSVCPQGCTYRTIAAALEDAVDGDTLGIRSASVSESSLLVTADILLVGQLPGEATPVIVGNEVDPVFAVKAGASATFEDLTIERGATAIQNDGTVRIRRCVIRHHRGSGLRNFGSMHIVEASIVQNLSPRGAGIYNSGSLELDRSTVAFNVGDRGAGAGIFNEGDFKGTLCRIADNEMQVSGFGGGLSNSGTAQIDRCDVIGNAAGDGGGIFNGGVLELESAAVDSNGAFGAGGGLFNDGVVRMDRSSVSRNAAKSGGGLFNLASAELRTSTISGNVVSGIEGAAGGGIFAEENAQTHLTSVTLAENISAVATGWAAGVAAHGIVRYTNSIIAGNFVEKPGVLFASDCGEVSANTMSLGYNLLGEDGGCPGGETGDVFAPAGLIIDDFLGPLDYYGGPTLVHSLLFGVPHIPNPAIDGGFCQIDVDQRGFGRPIDLPEFPDFGNACDIGAFERQFTE